MSINLPRNIKFIILGFFLGVVVCLLMTPCSYKIDIIQEISKIIKENFGVLLTFVFLIDGFLWTTRQMYVHEMRFYDCSTYEALRKMRDEDVSPEEDCPKKNIVRIYYMQSISHRVLAIYFTLATIPLLLYTLLLLLIFFLIKLHVNNALLIFFICTLILLIVLCLLYYRFRSEKYNINGYFRLFCDFSDYFPLLRVKSIIIRPIIWNFIKDKDIIVEGVTERAKFIRNFQNYYQ